MADVGVQAEPRTSAAYALSRALYRRLVPFLTEAADPTTRQRVLDACETTMRRLVGEPDFARPERFLFERIRPYFPLHEQVWVRRTPEVHIRIARDLIAQLPEAQRACAAFTRAGSPCQRAARPGSEYCPSHKHLELGRAGGLVGETGAEDRTTS